MATLIRSDLEFILQQINATGEPQDAIVPVPEQPPAPVPEQLPAPEPVTEEPAPAASDAAPAKPKELPRQQARAARALAKIFPDFPRGVPSDLSTADIRKLIDQELTAENKVLGSVTPGRDSINRLLGRRPRHS